VRCASEALRNAISTNRANQAKIHDYAPQSRARVGEVQKAQKHETRHEGGPVPGKRGNIEQFGDVDTLLNR
jgi:hypothetical protein